MSAFWQAKTDKLSVRTPCNCNTLRKDSIEDAKTDVRAPGPLRKSRRNVSAMISKPGQTCATCGFEDTGTDEDEATPEEAETKLPTWVHIIHSADKSGIRSITLSNTKQRFSTSPCQVKARKN